MDNIKGRALQAFRRVAAWFIGHPGVIAGSGSSATALTAQITALQGVIDRVTAQAADQIFQAGQSTLAAHDELALRDELRNTHLKTIVDVARTLVGQVPGMGVFTLPPRRQSPERQLHAAQAIRNSATPYKAVFLENGLPADFLEQLDGSIAALQSSIDARGTALNRQSAATNGLADDVELGKGIVKKMNASLTHSLKSDPATLLSWQQAKRVTIKGVQPATTPVAAPATGLAVVNGKAVPQQSVTAPSVTSTPPAPAVGSASVTATEPNAA